MRITWPISIMSLAAGWVAFSGCSGQSPQVVVDAAVSRESTRSVERVSLDHVDHSAWNGLLAKYVNQDGMVKYAAWKKSATDLAELKQYLTKLSQADPSAATSKNGKLAFWINAYNALTIQGILDVYPTSSIRNHTAAVIGYNIWDDLLLPVGSKKYSLNKIEHEILRKQSEPRIHFAIVCASIGCPRLLNEAYVAERIEGQLAGNTRDFFQRRKNIQVNVAEREIKVSSILDWFGEDFGPTPQKALAKLLPYITDQSTKDLISSGRFTVSFLDYNWDLNEQ